MNFQFAFVFLLGLSSAFAAPGLLDSSNDSQGNKGPVGAGIPFLGEIGNALGGGAGGGGSQDNNPLGGLSNIPFLGGFANAFQEGIKGGQEVLKKGLDTGKTAAQTGLKIATGFVPFKLPI